MPNMDSIYVMKMNMIKISDYTQAKEVFDKEEIIDRLIGGEKQWQ